MINFNSINDFFKKASDLEKETNITVGTRKKIIPMTIDDKKIIPMTIDDKNFKY
jgi:hypothetical protein